MTKPPKHTPPPEGDIAYEKEGETHCAALRAELGRINRGIAIRKAVINDLETRKKAILAELGQ